MITLTVPDRPRAKAVRITDELLTVDLMDGRQISVPLSYYPTLTKATPEQRLRWEFIGRGGGLDWPDLDLQLSVEGIVAGWPEQVLPASYRRKHPRPIEAKTPARAAKRAAPRNGKRTRAA